MLEAYLDESGTHGGSKMICVASYVGNRKEWYSFEKEWAKQLDDVGINYFHAKDAKCNSLKIPLASAIDKRKLLGVVCSVPLENYKKYTTMRMKSSVGNAYAICTFMCAWEICKIAKEAKLGPISFIIESGQPNESFVKGVLESMMNDDELQLNIGAVASAKKADFIPLQTADFLSNSCSTYDRDWFGYLMRGNNRYHGHLTSEVLIETSNYIEQLYTNKRHQKLKVKKALKEMVAESEKIAFS